jgi:DNA-binding PadR family transcriptional regulator
MTPADRKLVTREILLGFWKVHILHHAAEHPVVGQWVLTELRRHGYDISPGTLYPLLKRMERHGWLRSESDPAAGLRGRRYYHLTARGASVLDSLRATVAELHHEIVEDAKPSRALDPVRLVAPSGGTAGHRHTAAGRKNRPAPPRASVRTGGGQKRRKGLSRP